MRALRTRDTEVGTERYCPRCDEWWPDDAEFFYISELPIGYVAMSRGKPYVRRRAVRKFICRACQAERHREWRQRTGRAA